MAGKLRKALPARVRSLAPGQGWKKDRLPLALAAMGNLRVPVITFAACAKQGWRTGKAWQTNLRYFQRWLVMVRAGVPSATL